MAGQDHRSRRASAGGDLLPATGCVAVVAPASTTRSVGREWETLCDEIAAPDSLHWPDSSGAADRVDPDTPSRSFRGRHGIVSERSRDLLLLQKLFHPGFPI